MSTPSISVCIATYRRPQRLLAVLEDLAAQTVLPQQVVIVDNDAVGSARSVVDAFRARPAPFTVDYAIQPERNIALTRNRTVALAFGAWLAFIDDDERAPASWLQALLEAAARFRADGVLAPVLPRLPDDAPDWLRRGRFYDFPRMPSGTPVPLNQLRFGNVLLRAEPVRAEPGPFDPAYGLTTGEDGDLLLRMIDHGARIVWCDEACVEEPVEPARLSLRWLRQRAYSGGLEYARKRLSGRYGPVGIRTRVTLLADASAKLALSAVLAALLLPFDRSRAAHWALRVPANRGKLAAFFGTRYSEYASASASSGH